MSSNKFTRNMICTIKDEVTIFDELKVGRLGNDGDGAVFNVQLFDNKEKKVVFTGHATDIANYLNGYFDLKE